MKKLVSFLAVVFLALFSAIPASAGDEAPAEGGAKRVWSNIGIRLDDTPQERLRVGQKASASVENPTKLSRHGITVKTNDKVVVTLTNRNAFTLLHTATGKSFKFTFDNQGNVTPAR